MNKEMFWTQLRDLEDPSRVDKIAQYMQAKESQESYAKGDVFLGIRVPHQRAFVKRWKAFFDEARIHEFLLSPFHEHRSMALIALTGKAKETKKEEEKFQLLSFYREHLDYINHWDLIDLSAPAIVGGGLFSHLPNIDLLEELAQSDNFWHQRVAIVATQFFIRKGVFEPTLKMATIPKIMKNPHPMVQKALGWMLKEVGEKNLDIASEFLRQNGKNMLPLALSRAKEKYPPSLKSALKF